MRRGAVVEMGATERVFGNPLHPYTKTLLMSVPQLHTKWKDVEAELRGRRRRRAGALGRRRRSSRSRTTTSSARRRRGRGGASRRASAHRRRRRAGGHPVGGAPGRARATSSGGRAATRSSRATTIPRANSIFNSAVVPYGDGFAGVFRVDDTRRVMNLHAGRSADGVDWAIDAGADRVRARRPARRARRPGRSSTPTTRA